ncbi:hypothetical protein Tco_1014791 [Tanacetum coccineum]
MLERSTGIAGVTKATLGPEEARTSQSRTASPLGRQGAALSPSELVHWRLTYDVRISQTSGPQQVLEHEDNFDPEDKV